MSLERLQERQKQEEREQKKNPHFYLMTLRSNLLLDATRKGNLSRFMNHSCAPNCVTQKWIVNGRLRIGIFAKRPIRKGVELTFDYKFVRFGKDAQVCLCGEGVCKGTIGQSMPSSKEKTREPPESSHDEDSSSADSSSDEDEVPHVKMPKTRTQMERLARSLLREIKREFVLDALKALAAARKSYPNLLAEFLRDMHGLQTLSLILGQSWRDFEVVGAIVGILEDLSIPAKNAIIVSRDLLEDARIEERLGRLSCILRQRNEGKQLADNDEGKRQELAGRIERLLENWKGLVRVYKIPKISAESKQSDTVTAKVPSVVGYSLKPTMNSITRPNIAVDFRSSPVRLQQEVSRPLAVPVVIDRSVPEIKPIPKQSFQKSSDVSKQSRSSDDDCWRRVVLDDGRSYYYHIESMETRWQKPEKNSSQPTPQPQPQTAQTVNTDEGVEAIIARAREAALKKLEEKSERRIESNGLCRSLSSSSSSEGLGRKKKRPTSKDKGSLQMSLSNSSTTSTEQTSSNITDQVSQLVVSHLSRAAIRSQLGDQFKKIARRLTHAIVEKEERRQSQREFTLSEKRNKIVHYIDGYLKNHGYRID